jgi:LysM domain
MSSLSVHLRLPEDHSGLPFHPSCPVCRHDRLAGSLEEDEIVSRRTQAAIAAGLLAFSGLGAPAAAVAAGPDLEIDGSDEVATPDPGEPALDGTPPRWTDGGEALPEAEEPTLAPGVEEPVEPEASEPVEEPLVEAAGEEPATEIEPAPEPVAVAAPPAVAPTATTVAPEPAASDGVRVDAAKRTLRVRSVKRTKPAVPHRVIAAPAPALAPGTASSATVRVVVGTSSNQAAPGGGFHVVQQGESLWSIASDLLGDQASVDRVAREVGRLWELNAERIGTGSPDLLYAGTRLRLR